MPCRTAVFALLLLSAASAHADAVTGPRYAELRTKTLGEKAVLTYNDVPAWLPVTVDEYLDAQAREIEARTANVAQTANETADMELDEAEIQANYAAMKAVDPQQAEDYMKMMDGLRRQMAQMKRKAVGTVPNQQAAVSKEAEDLNRFRASLGADERSAQAALGNGPYFPAAARRGHQRPSARQVPGALGRSAQRTVGAPARRTHDRQ